MREQALAEPSSAKAREDEQVLEVEAGPGEKRRVVVKEEREAGWLLAVEGQHHFGRRTLAEERLPDQLLRSDGLIGEPLVRGESADTLQDDRRVGGDRWTERERQVAIR